MHGFRADGMLDNACKDAAALEEEAASAEVCWCGGVGRGEGGCGG